MRPTGSKDGMFGGGLYGLGIGGFEGSLSGVGRSIEPGMGYEFWREEGADEDLLLFDEICSLGSMLLAESSDFLGSPDIVNELPELCSTSPLFMLTGPSACWLDL